MSKKKKHRDKKTEKNIAERRINYLFTIAEKNAHEGRLNLSNRYVEIARRISMKYQVPIPRRFKRCFCKHCYSYLLPYVTCRTRINRGKIVIFCKKCNKYTRIPLH